MADLMALRRRILMDTGQLPPIYRPVDYIQAASSAFLALDYVPTKNDEFSIKFMIDSLGSGYEGLLSAGTGTYQLIALGTANAIGSMAFYVKYFRSGGATLFQPYCASGVWYTLTITNDGVFHANGIDSAASAYQAELDGANTSLYIFRRRDTTSPFIGKLAAFTVTNNSTAKLNLIPCVRLRDNRVGAYDTVSRKFYGSASAYEEFTPSIADA